jgi:heterodisulfide reductase subunit A-like polyferredoxin
MIALKQAVLARKIEGAEVRATIFFMDMRAFGKDHDRYLREATSQQGVELVRCRVHDVKPCADGDLRVRYYDETSGERSQEVFDLVVLSTGQAPGGGELARLAGLPVSEATGYPPASPLEKVRSARDGVFLCGSVAGLTDIGDAVTCASAAAGEASKLMQSLGRDLVEPAVQPERTRCVTQRVMVIGGGLAAMRAALSLAERGIGVDLVEQGRELPGETTTLGFPGLPSVPKEVLEGLAERVSEHELVALHPGCRVVDSRGPVGAFESDLRDDDGSTTTISHGATIVATTGREAATSDYGHGQSDRVITQAELLRRMRDGRIGPDGVGTVVMIQCVGSREAGGREYCSRVCCAHALEAAIELLERDPEARILVLARDVMTCGQSEGLYTRARKAGVLFARYSPACSPRVSTTDGETVVVFRDEALQRPVEVRADLLVLATGLEPDPINAELAGVLGLEVRADGFFQEADAKWRPLEAWKAGVFFAGLAHQAQSARDQVAQAEAAAQLAWALLARPEVAIPRAVATVRHGSCCRCLACVQTCPFHARTLDPDSRKIVVDELACQACGLCAVACQNNAAEVVGMQETQTLAGIEAQLEEALWS